MACILGGVGVLGFISFGVAEVSILYSEKAQIGWHQSAVGIGEKSLSRFSDASL